MGKVYLHDRHAGYENRKRICHVNMLKDFHVGAVAKAIFQRWSRRRNSRSLHGTKVSQQRFFRVGEELDGKQRSELTELLFGKFAKVPSDKPERTSLYKHRIETDNAQVTSL